MNRAKLKHFNDLSRVVTMAEAARLVHRDPKTLRLAIDTGNLAAVQCGRIWLVSVSSLIELYPPVVTPKKNRLICRPLIYTCGKN